MVKYVILYPPSSLLCFYPGLLFAWKANVDNLTQFPTSLFLQKSWCDCTDYYLCLSDKEAVFWDEQIKLLHFDVDPGKWEDADFIQMGSWILPFLSAFDKTVQ